MEDALSVTIAKTMPSHDHSCIHFSKASAIPCMSFRQVLSVKHTSHAREVLCHAMSGIIIVRYDSIVVLVQMSLVSFM